MIESLATALCPGSFDPVTVGHVDIIERTARQFDDVLVAVVTNPSKAPLFALEERKEMLREVLNHVSNVEIDSFDGLLVDYAKGRGITVVVKGLRAVSDFDYEIQMAQMNHKLTGLETLFMAASPKSSYLSSSLIKEVARYGGDVTGLVPDPVVKRLADRFGRRASSV